MKTPRRQLLDEQFLSAAMAHEAAGAGLDALAAHHRAREKLFAGCAESAARLYGDGPAVPEEGT